jgi:hypothetical protein
VNAATALLRTWAIALVVLSVVVAPLGALVATGAEAAALLAQRRAVGSSVASPLPSRSSLSARLEVVALPAAAGIASGAGAAAGLAALAPLGALLASAEAAAEGAASREAATDDDAAGGADEVDRDHDSARGPSHLSRPRALAAALHARLLAMR